MNAVRLSLDVTSAVHEAATVVSSPSDKPNKTALDLEAATPADVFCQLQYAVADHFKYRDLSKYTLAELCRGLEQEHHLPSGALDPFRKQIRVITTALVESL